MLNEVKVGGVNYSIDWNKEVVIIDGDANYAGGVRYTTSEIEILDEMSEYRKKETFAHELLHAMLFEAGYKEEHDEEMVVRLGLVLNQVLQDNDFSWMQEKECKEIKTKNGTVKIPIVDGE